MDLPSFIWLWKIAAWSMGLSLLAYSLLAVTGIWMFRTRTSANRRFGTLFPEDYTGLRIFHYVIGITMVILVILLLCIGIIGTLGEYGSLGHSQHLSAGLITVLLVLVSAGSAILIRTGWVGARCIHVSINIALFFVFAWVSLSGWTVVQRYLP
ncbi:MAG: DUF4079 domain-containing protein [Richelia sp. RM2_1_2]|nr:DUF4079 domain-containing protein [Richelia sp. SM2_1_7]NJM21195.1 DUF4079 domain-containing protein [Richelia sp. SM1_7_0]NJN06854.1 DUF4079 domain-containing protein [Richelia sp. RM1_1_1]NJO26526.1 DUF4079 domain-containing protein [Richelia sp. SL_2_1]NJO57348.1 DUF4079 domain-containing protein [Richelia sp. RM2_1_2]